MIDITMKKVNDTFIADTVENVKTVKVRKKLTRSKGVMVREHEKSDAVNCEPINEFLSGFNLVSNFIGGFNHGKIR